MGGVVGSISLRHTLVRVSGRDGYVTSTDDKTTPVRDIIVFNTW